MIKFADLLFFTAFIALAQSGRTAEIQNTIANQPLLISQTGQGLIFTQVIDQTRQACIEGRRSICGKIVKILPDGVVVDSGFTNLFRAPLNHSWLAPSTVSVARSHNLIESHEPNSLCIGLIFLTELPESRSAKPKLYDYVMIEGYPAEQFTYSSISKVYRTVRKFSANLDAAINWNLKNNIIFYTNSPAYPLPATK